MLFRRIAVRNFRKLSSPVVIDDLRQGVTIIAGDNEEGKSTLLLAIRTVLFERHNLGGRALEAMQPLGFSVRPEIELAFEIDGENFSITKGFAYRSSAVLMTPTSRLEGPAAEEHLAQLLRFRVPHRGESRPDDRGILGLFWLEQGCVLQGLGFGEIGRSTLRSALEQEVGDVLGGARGCRLLGIAKAKRDALLTTTGRPRADLAAAVEEAGSAEQRVVELEAERRTYDQEIDDLARVRRELARIDADQALESARQNLAAAQAQAKSIEQLRQQDDVAGQAVVLAAAQAENAGERWKHRQALIQASRDREEEWKNANATAAELEKETETLASRLNAAEVLLSAAVETTHSAEERVALSQGWTRATALDAEIAELDRRFIEVNELVAERTAAQDCLTSITIDQRAFEQIRRLESAMREAQAALGAVATRVRFSPSAAQQVSKNEEEIPAEESVEVTQATRFTLEGFGAVYVDPGASELRSRRARVSEAETALARTLDEAGVEDLTEASARLEERTKAETAMNEAARLIAVYAPAGTNALQATRRQKSAERSQLDKQHDFSSATGIGDPETETRELVSARAREETARKALGIAERDNNEHATRLAVAKQATNAADKAFTATKKELDAARAEVSDADLYARLEAAQGRVAQKKLGKEQTEERLAAANPEEIELRRNRAEAALRNVEAEKRRLSDDAIGLEGRLAALGKNGIGELLQETREQATRAVVRRNRLQAEASAWDLLARTLSGAERDAKEAFLEPILKTVDPFLRLLFPNARLTLDEETLEITEIARDDRTEPYAALSVGTREQLSILVRLAFAVYLRGRGYPAAVILDDAMVYADDDRFERMQLALRKAAETVQILILTCRPRDWRQFGAPIRRLAEVTTPALEPA